MTGSSNLISGNLISGNLISGSLISGSHYANEKRTAMPRQIHPACIMALTDPRHWRSVAKKIREKAATMTDPQSERALLWVAETYERLAAFSDRPTDSDPPPYYA